MINLHSSAQLIHTHKERKKEGAQDHMILVTNTSIELHNLLPCYEFSDLIVKTHNLIVKLGQELLSHFTSKDTDSVAI